MEDAATPAPDRAVHLTSTDVMPLEGETVRRRALELGFDVCRVTTSEPPASGARFLGALAEGRHGNMEWLARNAAKRVDPQLVLPGARSVVVLGASYFLSDSGSTTPAGDEGGARGVVARYARRTDYHETLAEPLKLLAGWLDAEGGAGSRSLWYVDTGPVLERDLAQRAGVGFVGKHTNLISRTHGNWLLLAEILTTVSIAPDAPEHNHCGSCTRCLGACPTGCITAPFQLDARRCISYLTIELKGSIPVELRPLIGNRVFGCDDCLAICPWNRFAREGNLLKAGVRDDLKEPDLIAWLGLDAARFKSLFAGTPLARTKRRGILRNVCVALGNIGTATALPALRQACVDPEPLIAEHAAWAVNEIQRRTGS
jgi:epoxyqueuosine reductase